MTNDLAADAIEARILALISTAIPGRFRKTPITRATSLKRDLGLDSLGLLSMLFRFEQEFGVDVARVESDLRVDRFRTVGDVLDAGIAIVQRHGQHH
jgi:acyl carrier protein